MDNGFLCLLVYAAPFFPPSSSQHLLTKQLKHTRDPKQWRKNSIPDLNLIILSHFSHYNWSDQPSKSPVNIYLSLTQTATITKLYLLTFIFNACNVIDEDTLNCFWSEFFECFTRLLRRGVCASPAGAAAIASFRIFGSTSLVAPFSLRLLACYIMICTY